MKLYSTRRIKHSGKSLEIGIALAYDAVLARHRFRWIVGSARALVNCQSVGLKTPPAMLAANERCLSLVLLVLTNAILAHLRRLPRSLVSRLNVDLASGILHYHWLFRQRPSLLGWQLGVLRLPFLNTCVLHGP